MDKNVNQKRMHRDNWLSVLIGPMKFLVPTFSYIILYPLMISETSIEVVGAWSLIASVISFIGITDIGFSQLLTRDAGHDRVRHRNEVYFDFITAKRTYIVFLFVLISIFIVANEFILAPLEGVYSNTALFYSVIFLLIGAFIQLSAKLDSAILIARHDNYFVQIVMSITPILTFSAAIIGTLYKMPIEGFAIGTVLASIANILAYKFRLSHHHNDFFVLKNTLGISNTLGRFFSLIKRGWHLYSCSIGMMIRGPIFRLVVVSTIGLQAAAIFDIAMRITQTVRDVIATGFSVLFPSFSLLSRQGERVKTIELIQVSLLVLLSLGSLSLGVLMVAIELIFSLWLGVYPYELVPTTRILAIWQILTIANVPFWHLLHATHNERVAAYSIWMHTVAILLAIPFSTVFTINILNLTIYWTATSIITQGLIYYYVQRKLSLLWDSILNPRTVSLLILVSIYSYLSYWEASHMPDMVVYFVFTTAIFLLIAILLVIMPLYRYVKIGSIPS